MCGIYGFINTGRQQFSELYVPLEKLSILSYRRGKEAAGMAVLHNDTCVDYIKSDLDGRKLLKTKDYKHFKQSLKDSSIQIVIGHSRIATHGSQLVEDNNQPVVSSHKKVIGVHNGIITNTNALWDAMGRKDKIPDLDTQVLMDYLEFLLDQYEIEKAFHKIFEDIEGAASIAVILPAESKLVLGSNTGSLFYTESRKSIFFASESVFLQDTFNETDASVIHQISPPSYCSFGFNENASRKARREIHFQNDSFPVNLSSAIHLYAFKNDLNKLKRHDFDYKRIYSICRCTKCLLPVTTPFITFDKSGVCNFCNDHQQIQHKGENALFDIVDKIRKGNGEPDCLAAFSGGRDSSYGLHYLKKELGLQPLAYTYDWGMVTDMARRNQSRILGKLGIEHIVVSADITMKRNHIRKNILAWMKKPDLGMVPLFMEGDKQCEFYANKLMKQYNLKMMFFFRGNELEKEEFKNGHCGIKDADPGGVIHHLPLKNKIKLLSYYGWQYLRNPAYFNASFFDTMLAYFSTYVQAHDYLYLWHYIPWKEEKIISTLRSEYDWETSPETNATWRTDDGSSAFYNYIYYCGQGFTENDSFRSRQIREGLLNRTEAWEMVCEENKPRYEALRWYFDMIGLDGDAVLDVVDNMKKLY
jgi:glutamine---fructose-6-phosphate transaminase (isomerizing)